LEEVEYGFDVVAKILMSRILWILFGKISKSEFVEILILK
jgi:hypothetical protein